MTDVQSRDQLASSSTSASSSSSATKSKTLRQSKPGLAAVEAASAKAPPLPPPIDISRIPPNSAKVDTGIDPKGIPGASEGSATSKSAPRRYERWAHPSDSPRLTRTVHDFALFLSSLPVPLHRYIPRIAARLIARALARNGLMATNIAFDIALFFWRCIINIFFRSVQPRGAWRIPKDGPVIFVGAPHHNQFIDPLLLASEVRRGSGRRVAFLIAEKSIKRRFIGSAARIMQSIPVARAADGAKPGKGRISVHPSGDPLLVQGHGTAFKSQLVQGGQIVLPKWTGHASGQVVEVISDTEVKIKKEWKDERAKDALNGKQPPKANKDGASEDKPGTEYQCLPYVDQTEMYASVYEKLAGGGCIGIFPEGGSHDRTDLLPLKAGVVIMALGAMSANPGLRVRIVPVGLSYFHPDKFRSRAVVEFGAPLDVSPDLIKLYDGGGDGKRKAVGDMLNLVFDGLKSVTVRAPDYETLMLIQAARRLYTPPGQHLTLPQVVELNRRFIIGYLKFKDDPRIQKLKADVLKYNKMLGYSGLKDHQVERATRAGWRSLGLLGYRLELLLLWGSLALPGVVLNAPIIILAKIISRIKAREALAASQVKLKGRDVVGTWKVLVSLGVAPVLYLTYAIGTTYMARRLRPDITTRQLAMTPLYTMMLLPVMSYSTLKISETAIDIVKSLPPLFVSLLPGNQKVISDLQNTRKQLTEEMQSLIDEMAPQVWEDFESSRWRILHPSSATPPPSTPDGRKEAFMWKAKDARSRGASSDALTHPLAWADERLFGWRSGRAARPDASGKKRRASSIEREKPLTAAEFSGEHPTVEPRERAEEEAEAAAVDGAIEEEEEDEEGSDSTISAEDGAGSDEEGEEGDYEAIFSFLNPSRLLSSRHGPESPKTPRVRSGSATLDKHQSGGRSRSGSQSESFASKRNRSSSELSKIVKNTAISPTTPYKTNGSDSTSGQRNTSPTSASASSSSMRRRRTHSLTQSIPQDDLAAAAKPSSPTQTMKMPFVEASEALEAQQNPSKSKSAGAADDPTPQQGRQVLNGGQGQGGAGELAGASASIESTTSSSSSSAAAATAVAEDSAKPHPASSSPPGTKPPLHLMQEAAKTPGGSQEASDAENASS